MTGSSEETSEVKVAGVMKVSEENGKKMVSFRLNFVGKKSSGSCCGFCSSVHDSSKETKTTSHIHDLIGFVNVNALNHEMTFSFPVTYKPSSPVHKLRYQVDGEVYELNSTPRSSDRSKRKRGKEMSIIDSGKLEHGIVVNPDIQDRSLPATGKPSNGSSKSAGRHENLQAAGDLLQVTFCPQSVVPMLISCGPDTADFLSKMRELGKLASSVQSTYECESCDMKTTSYFPYIEHVFRHKETRPYVCSVCQASFQTRAVMRHHLDMHGGKAPFQCEFCGKRFRNSCHMKEHRLKHTGEKPYICSQCKRPFAHKNALKIHMQQHTGRRPFQCDLCGKLFRDQHRLRKHMEIHDTQQNSYECNDCGQKFRTLMGQKSHRCKQVAEVHTDEVRNEDGGSSETNMDSVAVIIPEMDNSFLVDQEQIGPVLIEISMETSTSLEDNTAPS